MFKVQWFIVMNNKNIEREQKNLGEVNIFKK
jgi:hypothetical protein